MTSNEKVKQINQKIIELQEELEQIKNKQEEFLEQHWLTNKMASLGFELESFEIYCYDDNIYYLNFSSEEDEDIAVTFYGNADLSKVFFYEVTCVNFLTKDNYTLKDLFKVLVDVNNLVAGINKARKIMHKEFPKLEDFSENFEKEYDNFIDNRKVVKVAK